MIKISEVLKQISNGLACQYACDFSSRRDKDRFLNSHSTTLKTGSVIEFVPAKHEDETQCVDMLERSAA